MKKNSFKSFAMIAAAGIMTAGISMSAMAAPGNGGFGGGNGFGGFGSFGGFVTEMAAPAEDSQNIPEAKDQRPDMAPEINEDGSAAGEITDLQTPPEAPLDENGNPMAPPDGDSNGQMPEMQNGQMPGHQDVSHLIESIEDEDTKSEIQALADALQDAMDAEKTALEDENTDEEDLTALREAVQSAREALDSAVKTYLDENAPADSETEE